MTKLCAGGGPSGVKPGTQPTQTFLANGIADFLLSNGAGWFATLAAGVGILSFDLPTFCATDPPALPTIDAARVAGYFNPLNPVGAAQLTEDALAIVGHYLWFQTCVCTTGPQPTPPGPLAQPTGLQTDNPQLTSPTGTPCFAGPQAFEQIGLDTTGTGPIGFAGTNTIPAAATWSKLTGGAWLGGTTSTPAPFDITISVQQVVSGQPTNRLTFTVPAGGPINFPDQTLSLVPGGGTWTGSVYGAGQTSGSVELSLLIDDFCGNVPNQVLTPCCPPDPTLENLIAQVLRLEQLILNSLGGSDAYTRGTAHPGLQGSGTLAVSGLRGVAIDVTAGTPTNPLLEGVPPYQWNLGWVSISDAGGMLQEQRITRQAQIWLPPAADLGVTLGFFLFPGVVATLTELLPA